MVIPIKIPKETDPLKCDRKEVLRRFDTWRCIECGAEFILRKRKHKTKWRMKEAIQ